VPGCCAPDAPSRAPSLCDGLLARQCAPARCWLSTPNSSLAVTNAAGYADPRCLADPSVASSLRAPQNHQCVLWLFGCLLSYSSVCPIFPLLPILLREW